MSDKSEQYNPKETFIRPKNITVLDENSRQIKEFPTRRAELGWPVELRAGWGFEDKKSGEIKMGYVRGEKFLSFAVIIHELGHPKQDDLNKKIQALDPNTQHDEYVIAKERDAQTRGWDRAIQYSPVIIRQLERDFEQSVKSGAILGFSNFREFYEAINDLSVLIDQTINQVPEIEDNAEQERLMIKALREAGLPLFFENIRRAYIGEQVDTGVAQQLITSIKF